MTLFNIKKIVCGFTAVCLCLASLTYADSASQYAKPKPTEVYCKKLVIDTSRQQVLDPNNSNTPGNNQDCSQAFGRDWVAIGIDNKAIVRNGRFAHDYVKDAFYTGGNTQIYYHFKDTAYNNGINPVKLICAPRVLEFTPGACPQ